MDGDKENPTICGTGTEDYFGGSYNWDVDGKYTVYSLLSWVCIRLLNQMVCTRLSIDILCIDGT